MPASLHASLMARLDRLGPAKEVAQIGAVIGREFSFPLLTAVVGGSEHLLQSSLGRVVDAGILLQQGLPPHATYMFKHALVQDAAYGTLLREPKRALHARIAETLQNLFTDMAENQPELLARHCSEARLTEKAVDLCGKAGHRSLTRSAMVEAAQQFTRALDQIVALPSTPASRRQQIKFQVALATALMQTKGYGAPESKAALEQASSLIEQAKVLGEAPEDGLLLFSVLYGFSLANTVAFNGGVVRELAQRFLALADAQEDTAPRMIGHRLMGTALLLTGELASGRAHCDAVIRLYNPAKHQMLATRFGQDQRVSALAWRSLDLWLLGYSDAAFSDADLALQDARESEHAPTLMTALAITIFSRVFSGNYAVANAQARELVMLSEEKGAAVWKIAGIMSQGWISALTGEASNAVQSITSGIAAWRATGDNTVDTVVFGMFDAGLCGTWPNR